MPNPVRSAFGRDGVWAYHSLMHWIGESSRDRLEPRRFARLLKQALSDGRGFIVEPLPRIYVHRASERTVANDAANCAVQLDRLRARLHPDPTTMILESVLSRVGGSTQPIDSIARWQHQRRIGGEVFLPAVDMVWSGQVDRAPSAIWISSDVQWVQLHDVRLWRFIETCWEQESKGLIVARKIEPAVFALLSGLGLRGLQYHAVVAKEGLGGEASDLRSDLRWIRTQAVESFASHAMLSHIEPLFAQSSSLAQQGRIGTAIADGIARGFAGSRAPTVHSLLDWWTASGVPIPEKTLAILGTHGR